MSSESSRSRPTKSRAAPPLRSERLFPASREVGSVTRCSVVQDASRLRGQVSQRPGLHLGTAGQRELFFPEQQHPARHLVARQPLPQEIADRRLVECDALVRNGAGHDDLAQRLVRHADGLGDLDPGIGVQHGVDLERGDVGAAGLDDVREPSLPAEQPGLVDITAVAGVKEALRIERLVDRYADIAEHQGRALDGDLAALTARHHGTGDRIDDLQRVAREDLAVAVADLLRRRAGDGRRR